MKQIDDVRWQVEGALERDPRLAGDHRQRVDPEGAPIAPGRIDPALQVIE